MPAVIGQFKGGKFILNRVNVAKLHSKRDIKILHSDILGDYLEFNIQTMEPNFKFKIIYILYRDKYDITGVNFGLDENILIVPINISNININNLNAKFNVETKISNLENSGIWISNYSLKRFNEFKSNLVRYRVKKIKSEDSDALVLFTNTYNMESCICKDRIILSKDGRSRYLDCGKTCLVCPKLVSYDPSQNMIYCNQSDIDPEILLNMVLRNIYY